MKKFIVIYHTPPGFVQVGSSPEEMKKGMEAWVVWAKKCGDQLIDMGTPLGGGQSLKPDGFSTDSTYDVAGYSIVQASDMDAAKSLFNDHPHLSWDANCKIEIHECLAMPGM
ncbi:MAG: hypothetical protein OCD76_19885 [Reichenbachiella sp.]